MAGARLVGRFRGASARRPIRVRDIAWSNVERPRWRIEATTLRDLAAQGDDPPCRVEKDSGSIRIECELFWGPRAQSDIASRRVVRCPDSPGIAGVDVKLGSERLLDARRDNICHRGKRVGGAPDDRGASGQDGAEWEGPQQTHRHRGYVAPPDGFEPPTPALGRLRSIH